MRTESMNLLYDRVPGIILKCKRWKLSQWGEIPTAVICLLFVRAAVMNPQNLPSRIWQFRKTMLAAAMMVRSRHARDKLNVADDEIPTEFWAILASVA